MRPIPKLLRLSLAGLGLFAAAAGALETGLVDIRRLLSCFPDSVPASIEYPCGGGEEATETMRADRNKLRSW